MNPTPKQMARLPVWAQEHIGRLEIQRDEADRRASKCWQSERSPSCIERVFFDRRGPRYEYLDIGRAPVLFGDVQVSLRDGRCYVTTTGFQHLTVAPGCSNVVYIEAVKA
jgi:hypothetical protein